VGSHRPRILSFPVSKSTGVLNSLGGLSGGHSASNELPLVALTAERRRIEGALQKRQSLLVLGPRGSGKTRLLRECSFTISETAFIPYSANMHVLLQALAVGLKGAGHPGLSGCVPRGATAAYWASKQTSVRLRGILWTALEEHPARMILDGIEASTFPIFRFFQRIYLVPGMSIIASARDAYTLGVLGRLFWDPRKTLVLKPLNESAAAELFDAAARKFGIAATNTNEFRARALEAAEGNGSQIVEMCRLAAKPEYITASGKIKFELVRIDSLVRTLG